MARRILIIGGSGAGTSTLARGLATALSSQSFDTDDFYWRPTDPPFTVKRPTEERLALMEAVFLPRRDWVLAGSVVSWGAPIVPWLTHALFLTLPTDVRLNRLRSREARRHGVDGVDPAFLDWAAHYDDPHFTGRSLRGHEAWLATLPCPVIRLDASPPPDLLLAHALAALDGTCAGD